MSQIKQICFFVFGFVLLPSNKADTSGESSLKENNKGISVDYFYGETSLRSKYILTCKGDEKTLYMCYKHCGHSNFKCILNQCICIEGYIRNKKTTTDIVNMLKDIENLLGNLRSHIKSIESEQPSELLLLEDRPKAALRHHIAHFCPDLEMARKCIRSCMNVGKPAFCGKDHRCYCGHRYGAEDISKEIDIEEIQAQFRDLYTKYFGTGVDALKDGKHPGVSSEEGYNG